MASCFTSFGYSIFILKSPNYLSIPGFEWLLVVLSIKSKLLTLACKFSLSSTCLHLQTNLLLQSFHSLIACFFTATLIFFLLLEYAKFVLATGPLHLLFFLCTKLFTQILDKANLLLFILVGIPDNLDSTLCQTQSCRIVFYWFWNRFSF